MAEQNERIRGRFLTNEALAQLERELETRLSQSRAGADLAAAMGVSENTALKLYNRTGALDVRSFRTAFASLGLPFDPLLHLMDEVPRLPQPIRQRSPPLVKQSTGVSEAYLSALLTKVSTFPVDAFFHPDEDQSVALAAEVKVVEVKKQEKPSSLGPASLGGDRPTVLFGTPTPAAEFVEEAIKKSRKRQVLLLAEPGEGKSTLMRKLALSYHEKGLVPLFLECHDWNGAEVEAYITERYPKVLGVRAKEREATGRWLWEQVEAGEAVLLFDGLDEASEPEAAARTLAELGRVQKECRLVVTCRSATERNFCPQFHKAHLRPLEFKTEITPYVKSRLTDTAEQAKFLATIHPKTGDARTAQLATSGICLAMLLFLWQDNTVRFEPPISREALYEKLVETVFKSSRRRTRYPSALKTRALEAAAFEALFRGSGMGMVPTDTLYRTLQKLTVSREEWREFASEFKEIVEEIATQTGLLALMTDKKAFRFFHLTLLEWFAARHLAREWNTYWHTGMSPLAGWLPAREQPWRVTALPPAFPNGHPAHGLPPFRNLLFDPKLRETLLLLVGQMEATEFAVEGKGKSAGIEAWWMDQMAANSYLCDVGLQCLARCRNEHRQSGRRLIKNLNSYHPALNGVIPGLVAFGKVKDSVNQNNIIEVLLAPIQNNFEMGVIIDWSLKAIRAIGSTEATFILVSHLTNPDYHEFRGRIIYALGAPGSVDAVPTLISCLTNPDYREFRGRIIYALGAPGSVDAVPTLISCLTNPDYREFRKHIANTLCQIGSVDAVPILIGHLINPDYRDVRKNIIYALGHIDSVDAVPVLLEYFINPDYRDARKNIIYALSRIGSVDAVPVLIGHLINPDYRDVRKNIIEALSHIGSMDAVPVLIGHLINPDYRDVRKNIIYALSHIGSVDAVPVLLECLKSEDCKGIFIDIIFSLGHIGSVDAVPVLLECLKSEVYKDVCKVIIIALGIIGSADAVPILLECLKSEDYYSVRWSLGNTLGKIGFSGALDEVCIAWENENTGLRKRLMFTLYKLATIDPEKQKGLDPDED